MLFQHGNDEGELDDEPTTRNLLSAQYVLISSVLKNINQFDGCLEPARDTICYCLCLSKIQIEGKQELSAVKGISFSMGEMMRLLGEGCMMSRWASPVNSPNVPTRSALAGLDSTQTVKTNGQSDNLVCAKTAFAGAASLWCGRSCHFRWHH